MRAAKAEPAQVSAGAGVSVTGLAVNFGRLRALNGVDLVIEPGQIVALAGENGAGKSTLLRCIAGDIGPAAGQILIGGWPVPARPLRASARGVGVLWQDLSLCDNMSIAANLLLGREGRRQLLSDLRLHSDAADMLSGLGIPLPQTTRSVRALSGGERQLVAIARATDTGQRLLLLDEPTASLGVRNAARIEELIAAVRAHGATVVIACHDIDMMLRVADRIVVLRHGKVAADLEARLVHPDDVAALLSGQELGSTARRQLTRLHGLTGRLVSADPGSSLQLILTALGAALRCERLCIHLAGEHELICAAAVGMPRALTGAWSTLPPGVAGGPVGLSAMTGRPVVVPDVRSDSVWAPFGALAASAGIASSWSVPVLAPGGLAGVITVLPETAGPPERDQLELGTLYAGYAASAIERDRLLDELTARNVVLETIREVLEALTGPAPVGHGLELALQALRRGLNADQVALVTAGPDGAPQCRASAVQLPPDPAAAGLERVMAAAADALADPGRPGAARHVAATSDERQLAVTFSMPAGPAALAACWLGGTPAQEAGTLLEDAAHSLRLALEREQAAAAQQEASALRRSQELHREFLSRLSHELRTPLTAIRGYASSLLQPDVVWDAGSQRRFLTRVAAESARLGRLVDDLLDFSAIELGILRLHPDWCDIGLVLEAAAACLPPEHSGSVELLYAAELPAVWADHDRLEQVFVNLLSNAVGHNPPGTKVTVRALAAAGAESVQVTVADDGTGVPAEVAAAPFEPRRGRLSRTAGAGVGLSIASGIVAAHGGRIELQRSGRGSCFSVQLPVGDEGLGDAAARGAAAHA